MKAKHESNKKPINKRWIKMAKELIWRKINCSKNSECAIALKNLDFENFWQDNSFGQNYLHIKQKDEDVYWRVYCKKIKNPRIAMKDGVLYWLL